MLSIIAAFGLSFLFVYFIFESVGIGEYVWPILVPVFGWTFGIMGIVIIVVVIACKAVGGSVPSTPTIGRRVYAQPTSPTYDSPSTGSVYVVPVYCPYCGNKLELDGVEWIGSSDLTCPTCLSVVQAGIRENF